MKGVLNLLASYTGATVITAQLIAICACVTT